MTRRATISILALSAVAACGRKGARSSDFDSATAAALATNNAAAAAVANLPKVAHVSSFEFARRLDQHYVPYGGPVAQFGPNDSILVSIRTQFAASDVDVSARLRQNNKTVDSAGTKTGPADSTGASLVGVRFGPLKKGARGAYRADVFLDGKFQVSKDFTVIP